MIQDKSKLYARALAEEILEGKIKDDKSIDNFVKIFVAAGLEGRSKEVLDLANDIILAKQGKRKILLESARRINASQRKILENILKPDDIIKEKISPELIAGIKIIINDSKQFDASMQSKLRKIHV